MTHSFIAAAAAVSLLACAGAAPAQATACQGKAAGADWKAQLTVVYTAAGVEQISSLRVEARGLAGSLSDDNPYGWNVDAASPEPLGGWIGIIRHRSGAQARAQLDVAAPEMFDFDAMMMGGGNGQVPLSLRVVADGAALLSRPAPLVGPAGPWPTSAVNSQKARAGDARAQAADNAEAMAAADRLARARRVKVEVVDAKGATAGVMAFRDGVLPEAFAAESGLRQRAAADLAAGRCNKM